ncbi:hypothetical protein [Streptomyces sp.]|uniref:hypothetical protein n=1 Tax=Streptomyces sp. TaxID=1931 RepID=UPI002F40F45E
MTYVASVSAVRCHIGLDDPEGAAAQAGQIGPVRQHSDHRRASTVGETGQDFGPGAGHVIQELVAREVPVGEKQHALVQQRQQLPCVVRLAGARRSEDRPEQTAGAGFAQSHQPDVRESLDPSVAAGLSQVA